MDGAGDPKGFRRVRLANRDGTDLPGRVTACAKVLKKEHAWCVQGEGKKANVTGVKWAKGQIERMM